MRETIRVSLISAPLRATGMAGLAGVPTAMTLSFQPPNVARSNSSKPEVVVQ